MFSLFPKAIFFTFIYITDIVVCRTLNNMTIQLFICKVNLFLYFEYTFSPHASQRNIYDQKTLWRNKAMGFITVWNKNAPFVSDIMWNGTFVLGEKYYITLEVCNGARLCRKLSSNGVILDNSPPIHGLVRVSSHGDHQTYQPHEYVDYIMFYVNSSR